MASVRAAHGDPHAVALCRVDLDRAVQRRDVLLHDVHADATAGDVGHLIGRREARLEDEVPDLGVGHAVSDVQATLRALLMILLQDRPLPSSRTR